MPNVSKTKYMIFSPCKVFNPIDVYFNNIKLECVERFKYLGLIIDNKLKFNFHAQYICNKINQVVGLSYASSPYLNTSALITIYYSLIYSVMTQSIIIYGNSYQTHIHPIETAINKMLRGRIHKAFVSQI